MTLTPRQALSFSLAALACALPLSIAASNVALAALTAAVIWSCAVDGGRTRAALIAALRSPLFLALSVYAAWSAISAILGFDPAASLRLWPKDLHKLWTFLAISAALAECDVAIAAPALAAGTAIGAFVGIGQSLFLSGEDLGFVRARAFIHPVSFGEILGLVMIATCAFLARPGRTLASALQRRFTIAMAILLGMALVANETRAVLISLIAACAAEALREARWRRRILAVLLVLGTVAIFWEVLPTRGRTIRALFSTDPKTSSQRSRAVLWKVAWDIGRDNPVTGVGPGQFRRAFETVHPQALDNDHSWGNAHNLYLHQFAERGLGGVLALIALFWCLALGAWRAARARGDAWALASWAGTTAFAVMNLTESAWQTEQVGTLFLLLWLLGTSPRPDREIL